MGPNQTTGVINTGEDLIPVGANDKAKNTASVPSSTPSIPYSTMVGDAIPLLRSLEERFPFTASLISVIGYITIATFGQMNSLANYGGYIIFLLLILGVYKAFTKQSVEEEKKKSFYKNAFFILLMVTLICLGFLVRPYFPYLKLFYQKVNNSFLSPDLVQKTQAQTQLAP
jgi:Na+/proline symporter